MSQKQDSQNMHPVIISNVDVQSTPSAVYITSIGKMPTDGQVLTGGTVLPVASETQMGMMPFESFKQISTNMAAIESLKGVGRVAAHLGTAPAQADITAAWTAAKGENIPDGATVVNLDQDSPAGHAWTYLSTSPDVFEWVDRGTDTVNQASNTAPGIVKGTDGVDGKVFVENDGTMSVVGWDDIPTQAEIDAQIEQAITDHNTDTEAHPDIRALIGAGGSAELFWVGEILPSKTAPTSSKISGTGEIELNPSNGVSECSFLLPGISQGKYILSSICAFQSSVGATNNFINSISYIGDTCVFRVFQTSGSTPLSISSILTIIKVY